MRMESCVKILCFMDEYYAKSINSISGTEESARIFVHSWRQAVASYRTPIFDKKSFVNKKLFSFHKELNK